jgi:hypothetical protein
MAYDRGPQLFDPGQIVSFQNGITATAGGTQAAAFPLTAAFNRIAVCATAADSVGLPRATGGQEITLVNSGAAATQVFAAPGSTDTINGTAGATGISLAAAGKAQFVSPGPGLWFSILSA